MALFNRDIINGKETYIVGRYYVIIESKKFVGIYKNYGTDLVASKPSRNQAIKLAKLLNKVYHEGYEDGQKEI